MKPGSGTLWVAAKHGDECEDEETDNQQDFADSCPKFSLSIPLHGHQVDHAAATLVQFFDSIFARHNIPIEDNDNRDDRADRHNITPEVDDDVASDDFEGYKSSFEDEEVPASCDTESIIDEATCKSNER
jgi:hypothetical protein